MWDAEGSDEGFLVVGMVCCTIFFYYFGRTSLFFCLF